MITSQLKLSKVIQLEKWVYLTWFGLNVLVYGFLAYKFTSCTGENALLCKNSTVYYMFGGFMLDCLFYIFTILSFLALKLRLIGPVHSNENITYNRLQKVLMIAPIMAYVLFLWVFFNLDSTRNLPEDIVQVCFLLTFSLVIYYLLISITLKPDIQTKDTQPK
ncbi:MAG: hypothetical protein OHK0017_04710 [Patescibacteria group bacterium]